MAGKNFSRRVDILDGILGGIRRYKVRELLDRLNRQLAEEGLPTIAIRTLYNDLDYIEHEMGAPLHRPSTEDPNCYYTRLFSVRNLPLTEEELGHLKEAVEILRRAMPFMLGREMEQLVSKLENRIATQVGDRSGVIRFEGHTQASGSEWIESLFTAIRERCALRVCYKPYHKEAEERVFFPYLLKEFRSRWFVMGRYEGGAQVVNLALDRIESVRNSSAAFVENDLLDPESYFRNLIGVSIPYGAEVQEVELRVSASLAPYVRTKPIHHLQEVVEEYDDGSLRVRMPLYLNYELRSVLLGYGGDVEVIGPEALRVQYRQELERMLALHGQ